MSNQTDWRDVFGWQTEAEKRAARSAYEAGDGKDDISLNWWDKYVLGANADDAGNRYDRTQQRDLSNRHGGLIARSGIEGPKLGEDSTSLLSRAQVGLEEKEEKKIQDQEDRITRRNEPANRRADAQIEEQTAARREGNQILREQGNQNMQLAVMQMQENAATRRDDLLFRKEEARREDQRYNERMDQLDRKDRRALMQNMAMGLASLGAAFAL